MASGHTALRSSGGYALRGDALDARAQEPQPLIDPLVPAVDLADVPDLRLAVGAQRRDEDRHARPDVRALHPLAVKPARAAYDRAVRVADDHPSAHRDQLVDEVEAVLEHLLVNQDQALGLRRHRDGDAGEVGGERGPGAVL